MSPGFLDKDRLFILAGFFALERAFCHQTWNVIEHDIAPIPGGDTGGKSPKSITPTSVSWGIAPEAISLTSRRCRCGPSVPSSAPWAPATRSSEASRLRLGHFGLVEVHFHDGGNEGQIGPLPVSNVGMCPVRIVGSTEVGRAFC